MKNVSFLLLSSTRIFMFLLLSSFHFQLIEHDDVWRRYFIFSAMILFVCNHIFQFRTDHIPKKIISVSLDFLLSICFGVFFPAESGQLYLIFFGVISTTVFLVFHNRKILKTFTLVFILTWVLVSYEKYHFTGEFSIYENLLSFMYVAYGAIVGGLIRNLTRARETINDQYQQLNDSHEQLSDYSKQVEELTVIRERNQIAREIHDTVGHKMTALLVQLQLAGEYSDIDPKKSKEILTACEQLTRDSLGEIRLSVRTLREEDNQNVSFLQSLRELLYEFSKMTGLETILNLEGDPSLVTPSLQPTIKRIVQESLTNSKRHGLATTYRITANITEGSINIEIHDNGKGVHNVIPSFGLINMKERVQEHGGTIQFKSNDGEGFYIIVHFPLKQLKWSTAGVVG